jgi:hypothetical protein
MLKPSKPILTLKKVLEVEKHGLSINKSAYLLALVCQNFGVLLKKTISTGAVKSRVLEKTK